MLFSLLLLVIIDVCHIVQVCLDKLLRLERSAFCNFILAVSFAYSLLRVSLIQNWGAQKNLEIVFYSIIIASYELFLSSDQIFSLLCVGIKTIAISALAFHRKETELEKTFWLMVLVYLECFIASEFLRLELVVRLYCQEYLLLHSPFLWKTRTECTQAAFGSEGAGIGRTFSLLGQVLNLGFSLFRPFAVS